MTIRYEYCYYDRREVRDAPDWLRAKAEKTIPYLKQDCIHELTCADHEGSPLRVGVAPFNPSWCVVFTPDRA